MEMPTSAAGVKSHSRYAWDWAWAWTGVFIANLPIPVLFGYGTVGSSGLIGLLGAFSVVYWVGAILCVFRFPLGRSLVWGGGMVAGSQGFPVLHLLCGALGLWVWGAVGGHSLLYGSEHEWTSTDWRHNPNIGVFVVVLTTAHPVLVFAVLAGASFRAIRGDHPIWFTHLPSPQGE